MDDNTKNLIQSHIDTNEICLFMKGTPDAPQCGFSMAISNMLKILEVNYKGINVLESQTLREGIKEFSDWPTIPQVYIKGEFVGGCDIVKEMYENGELKKVFENKEQIIKMFDVRFFRMWEFYLASCESAFKWGDQVVYQFQLTKNYTSTPTTRNYIYS